MFRVEGLSKSFGAKAVVDRLSFEIKQGSCVALLGASGSGKTVIFQLLAGMMARDSGQFFVNEQQVEQFAISYMQQQDLLLPWYRVIDNAVLPLTLGGLFKQEAYAVVRKNLAIFGLAEYEQYYPDQLSGGMRQRVALLRATLHDKPLLLMDEPFSALDALTAQELRFFVKDWQKQQAKTIFFITHNVDEALDLADEIWILQGYGSKKLVLMQEFSRYREENRSMLLRALGLPC